MNVAAKASAHTRRDAIRAAAETLAAAGCETPRLDAEVLLAHALATSREWLLLEGACELDARATRAFDSALQRRARAREPVAYITGRRAFRALELAVDERALIPRPETELLVEIGLTLPAHASVLDVGTGCGAIALALKRERPDLRVSASEVDSGALSLARENARALRIDVAFLHADLLAGVPGGFDAVLANLPYVCEGERETLAPEILDHEPSRALFAGPDGLSAIRALLAQASERARLGLIALEVGAGHAEAVAALARAHGFADLEIARDLAGIERAVIARRRARG